MSSAQNYYMPKCRWPYIRLQGSIPAGAALSIAFKSIDKTKKSFVSSLHSPFTLSLIPSPPEGFVRPFFAGLTRKPGKRPVRFVSTTPKSGNVSQAVFSCCNFLPVPQIFRNLIPRSVALRSMSSLHATGGSEGRGLVARAVITDNRAVSEAEKPVPVV